jgi:AraC-like DNA-binding protein
MKSRRVTLRSGPQEVPDVDQLSEVLERFPMRAGVFFTGALCGTYDFDRAAHPGHLHFIRSGRVELIDAIHGEHSISEPSVIFMPDASSHRLVADAGVDALCANVWFGSVGRSPVIGALPAMVVLPLTEAPNLTALSHLMFDEARAHLPGRQAALNSWCELCVVALLRLCITKKLTHGGLLAGLSDARLCKALIEVHRQPNLPWSLDRLAVLAGMSRARFSARFHSVVGVTPGDHVAACRVAESQRLLLGGLPLKQVAEQVGYGSASALTRAFTRLVGIAPSQWLGSTSD